MARMSGEPWKENDQVQLETVKELAWYFDLVECIVEAHAEETLGEVEFCFNREMSVRLKFQRPRPSSTASFDSHLSITRVAPSAVLCTDERQVNCTRGESSGPR